MTRYRTCPVVHPEQREQARQELALFQAAYPAGAVTGEDIIQALSHRGPDGYFLTTGLYWECECAENYYRPQGMAFCEDCGSFASECPDARVHELRAHGIHPDYHDPAVRNTMSEHNLQSKRILPATTV